ncbi:chemosensory receptor a [Plakobranchus ocellatus]|uniref:Chemosensory receptor a n=1 Tax=Plakobranchus ocellatus TaxID=259542 RepID=A0AAV3YN13_9GAST|nr:chemosensory receptor a [Plakobranchus ocellatus]
MTNTTFEDSSVSIVHEFISDAAFHYIIIAIRLILNPALGITGTCTNLINSAAFFRMGLTDGITQNFFILSISDWVLSVMALINFLSGVLYHIVYSDDETLRLHPLILYQISAVSQIVSQQVSAVVTIVIAIVRCCCVALPLRVKYLLTASRQLAVILVFGGLSTFVITFCFAHGHFAYHLDTKTNKSHYGLVGVKWYTFAVFSNIYFYSSFSIVIICLIILSTSLYRSYKFRKTTTIPFSSVHMRRINKEIRIIKTVVLVSAIFLVCYSVQVFFSILRNNIKGFSPQGEQKNAAFTFLVIHETFSLINANANIFIYFFFNTRYRITAKTLLKIRQ